MKAVLQLMRPAGTVSSISRRLRYPASFFVTYLLIGDSELNYIVMCTQMLHAGVYCIYKCTRGQRALLSDPMYKLSDSVCPSNIVINS